MSVFDPSSDEPLIEPEAPLPIPDAALRGSHDLGWMLRDIDFERSATPTFFRAQMTDGVVTVPPWSSSEVKA